MNILDIAKATKPKHDIEIVGIRPGEKLHEQMIGFEDSNFTYEYHDYFKILPSINDWNLDKNRIQDGKKVSEGFTYSSDSNDKWMTVKELKGWIKNNSNKIGIFFKMSILVTGCAGFIGMHIKLINDGQTVVGVDNLNDYYNVDLKRARLSELQFS